MITLALVLVVAILLVALYAAVSRWLKDEITVQRFGEDFSEVEPRASLQRAKLELVAKVGAKR